MGKTFDEYRAEHLKEPFPLPMPDGKPVLLPKDSIEQERAVLAACEAARAAGTLTPFTGLDVLVGEADAARIAEAWAKLPSSAWISAMADMREHFGQGNSDASPSS